ncbi:MAG TPA: TolC family protein, partial [Candidatus Kapabacteria bacterium]|nr:TolC family protein [Candidatus Kapabacteria bacterium]
NAGANLTTPVFTGGKADAAEASATAARAMALASYQQSILTALREVNDALTRQHHARTLLEGRQLQQQAMDKTLRLAQLRYKNGYSGYLEVLTVQGQLYQMQMAVLESQRARLSAAVSLYKALGGGW